MLVCFGHLCTFSLPDQGPRWQSVLRPSYFLDIMAQRTSTPLEMGEKTNQVNTCWVLPTWNPPAFFQQQHHLTHSLSVQARKADLRSSHVTAVWTVRAFCLPDHRGSVMATQPKPSQCHLTVEVFSELLKKRFIQLDSKLKGRVPGPSEATTQPEPA